MIVTRLQNPLPGEPFAHEAAGFSYLATDFHYEHLVARLRRHLASTRGFYLVSGTPAPDGDLVERAINGHKDGRQRATLVRCRAGMTVDAVTRAFARQLGLTDERDNGQWALLSRLMEDSRKGVVRVLVLENADALDDRGFDELHRFATLDDPHLLPVVLLAERGFVQRLDAPSLQFLQPAIVAHLALQQLETEEVAAFIRYQLNATEGRHERVFTREVIAAIAAAAKGDPAAVNRLARQAAGIAAPAPAAAPPQLVTPAAQPMSAPAPSKIEPRLTLRPSEAVRPATPEPAAKKATSPAPGPSMPDAVAAPTKAPDAAATGKNAAPAAWLKRVRAMVPAATIAAYVVFAAGSATGLFYLLAPGAERGATVVAEAPQAQTVITSDLPMPAPRQVKPPAAEAIPAIPAVPESAAVDPPPAAPEPPAAAAAPAPSVAEQPDAPAPAVTAAPAPAAIEPAAGGKPTAESAAKADPAPTPVPPSTTAEPPVETVAKAEPTPTPVPPRTTATAPVETVAKVDAAPTPVPPSTTAKPPVEALAKAEPAPLPPRAADKPPSGAAAALVRRGEALLASGDIISARQFFARAAETGDAAAACGLGKSYDPVVLKQVRTRGVAGDPAKAADWYRRAARAGSNEAAARLARLLVKFPQ